MTLSMSKKIFVGFGLALLILLAIGVVWRQSTVRRVEIGSSVLRTHEALLELEGLSRSIEQFETTQSAYLMTGEVRYLEDTHGRYMRVNRVEAKILGVDHPDQVVGTTDFDYYTPSIAIEARGDEDRIIATGRALVDKVGYQTLATPDPCEATSQQNNRFFSTTKAPILGRHGQVLGIVGITRDITERRQAEAALREAEERFRTLVEQLPAITYVAALDAASSTIYTSPQIETMLGYSQAEWMADHELWRKQIHPDDYDRVMADIEQSQATGVPVPSEYRMLRRDGHARWFRDQAVIVRDADGRPRFMQGIVFDITERKQADEALRRSEARNRALVNAIPDLMFRLSRDGVFLDFKADRVSDLAVPPDALVGKTIGEALPPHVAQPLALCIERALDTGEIQIIEYQIVLENTPRDFDARIVFSGEHEVLAIVRDITERKNIERMKNEFISTVSHEMRTPLTSIRGSLGLIAGGVAGAIPARAQMMVDIAYKNSERLMRLINDILDIEKIESGKMAFNLQPLDLLPLVEQAIEANRAYGHQFNVTLTLENDAAGAVVCGDGDRLIQALTNLLSNAAKFSPPGEQVVVGLSRRDDAVRIVVSDRGTGIPETFRGRLFQKFAQADASDTRQKGGTGLGLSITKAIVEKHGGRIDYEPRVGGGTSFFLDLPAWRLAADAS